MRQETDNRIGKLPGIVYLIIGVVVFGSIWGLLEATLGGFLHLIIFPNKGAIMGGIGGAIMASALAIYKKPYMLAGIGLVSASFKLLDVWIFSLPVTSIHLINPAMAIIFESLAFSLVAILVAGKISRNIFAGVWGGVLAGMLSATAFVYFAIYVMNAQLLGRGITTAGAYITNQGIVQAAFLGVLFPLGYLAGEKLTAKSYPALARGRAFYAVSAAVICLSWGISAIAKLAGL